MTRSEGANIDLSAADRFADLWDHQPIPKVEQFVQSETGLDLGDLRDILAIDLRERWKRGDRVSAEQYLARFPRVAAEPELAFDVIYAELLASAKTESGFDVDSFLQRFPAHANRLRKQLELSEWMLSSPGPSETSADDIPDSTTQLIPLPSDAAASQDDFAAIEQVTLSVDHPLTWPLLQIPNYRLLGQLGHGGMAVVVRAEQLNLGRVVALKMVQPYRLVDESLVQRFLAEAEVTASLDHPHIVPVYDFGRVGKQAYFTMKLIEGGPLSERGSHLRDHPDAIAKLMVKIADAVHHAHQCGVLHRDLKPGNILLDTSGEPWVVDFGLAKLMGPEQQLTSTHDLVGTPCFLAPEQAFRGDKEPITVAADVYGLGAILYCLLAGKPPIQGATILETLDQLRWRDPTPPRRINRQIPVDLELICLKALSKAPNRRYLSADEFAKDLTRFLNRRPTVARPVTLLERIAMWSYRTPALATLIVVGALVLTLTPLLLFRHNRELAKLNGDLSTAVINAKASQQQAEVNGLKASRLAYHADMKLAYQAWKEGDIRQYSTNLKRYLVRSPDGVDVREAEWHFLAGLGLQTPVAEHRFPDESLYTAAYSEDGKLLLTAGKRSTVWAIDPRNGDLLWSLPTSQREINSVTFSSRGSKSFATAGDDGTVRIWDTATRQQLRVIQAVESGPAYGVAFARRHNYLATCGESPDVTLWNAIAGEKIKVLSKHTETIEALDSNPDGAVLATASSDGIVCLWSLGTVGSEKLRVQLEPKSGRVSSVAFSHANALIAVGTLGGNVKVFDADFRGPFPELLSGSHLDSVQSVAFFHGNSVVAAGDRSGTIRLWSLPVQRLEHEYFEHLQGWQAHEGRVYALADFHKGQSFASAGEDGAIRVWNYPAKSWQRAFCKEPASEAPYSRDPWFSPIPNTSLIVVQYPGAAEVWDASTGLRIRTILALNAKWKYVSVAPHGKQAAFLSTDDDKVQIWDMTNWERQSVHATGVANPRTVAWSHDSRLLVVGDHAAKDSLRIINAHTGQPVPGIPAAQYGLAEFSPTDPVLALTRNNEIEIWDTQAMRRVWTLSGQQLGIDVMAYSRDGKWLVAGAGDRRLRVWDLRDGKLRWVFDHRESVNFASFSTDGKTIYSALSNGQFVFWNMEDGQQTLAITSIGNGVRYGTLSGDGRHAIFQCHKTTGLTAIDLSQ